MSQKEEIENLKVAVNQLLVQLSIMSSENAILKSLVLDGIVLEKMSECSNNIYTNFVNQLERCINESMDNLEECLFKTNDSSFFLRQKFEVRSMISNMKNDSRYIDTDH